jgi:hypothetical protein
MLRVKSARHRATANALAGSRPINRPMRDERHDLEVCIGEGSHGRERDGRVFQPMYKNKGGEWRRTETWWIAYYDHGREMR